MGRKLFNADSIFVLPYHSCRNITCPDDEKNARKILCGRAAVTAILELPTDENVRGYLLEAEGKKRKRPTGVHRKIEETLKERPEDFSVLNSGVVIIARGAEVDEKNKHLLLNKPSIINGAQTQGVIRGYYRDCEQQGLDPNPAFLTYELIVTEDEGLISDTSIARNSQNNVLPISIAGSLGQLDDLEERLCAKFPDKKLRKSETDISEEHLETEHLIQVITALVPEEIYIRRFKESGSPNKTYAFSQKTKCLKEFQEIHDVAKGKKALEPSSRLTRSDYQALYSFYLDIAPQAYELYKKWQTHQGFKGTHWRKGIKRDENGNILDVVDGILFPILASLSVFAKKTDAGWRIEVPDDFLDEELIETAQSSFIETAKSDPPTMGKHKGCYSNLYRITSLYKRLTA
jgi:hypothetical protein